MAVDDTKEEQLTTYHVFLAHDEEGLRWTRLGKQSATSRDQALKLMFPDPNVEPYGAFMLVPESSAKPLSRARKVVAEYGDVTFPDLTPEDVLTRTEPDE